MFVGKNIINVGNLSGQNFSEDALTYSHNVCILDTETDNLRFIENPCAFNFYKLGLINSVNQLVDLSLKDNAVISLTVDQNNIELKNFMESFKNIVSKRVLYKVSSAQVDVDTERFKEVDYLKEFVEFVKDNMEITDIVNEELSKVVG